MNLMVHEVIEGLRPVRFKGSLLAHSDTERKMPDGKQWPDLSVWEKKAVGRWVDMDLYYVEPGQADPDARIMLPSGGYFFHIIGQSLVFHVHDSSCNKGIPVHAENTEIDVVPCWECDAPLIWDWDQREPEDQASLLVPPNMIVDIESPRHSLKRAATAAGIVREVEGRQLSTPAQRLLEIAMENDPAIGKVFRPPAA